MANLVGTATIKIIPNTAGFSAALNGQLKSATAGAASSVNGISGAVNSASTSLSSFGESLSRTGQRAILAGGAMTYGLTRPLIGLASTVVNTAATFEKSLATIAAVTNLPAGGAEIERIGVMARELAKTFPQDANQIASGLLDLARAGLDSADKIQAVIDPILQLSTIEDVDLSKASDLLVNVFTGFGGSFNEFGSNVEGIFHKARETTVDLTTEFTKMGDILALVSAATTTDLVDLGNAFRYAGPVAAAAGLEFAETASALGILAQAGFNATVGGTALRGIITRLAIPTKQSEEIFKKFGLSVDEAFAPEDIAATADSAEALTKQMKALGYSTKDTAEAITSKGVGSIDEFKTQLSGMGLSILDVFDDQGNMKPLQEVVDRFVTSGARVGDVMKLFGQRAGPAFLALMKQSEAFKELTAKADGANGTMEAMSATIQDTAAVKFVLLKNAVTDLAISVGESGMLDFFSNLAMRLTDIVRGLSETNPEIVKVVFVLGGLVAALGPATLIFGLFADSIGKMATMFGFLLSGPVAGAIAIVAGLALAFGLMYSQSESLRIVVGALGESFTNVLGPIFDFARVIVTELVGGIGVLAGMLGDALAPKIEWVARAINDWVSNGGLVEFLTGANEKIGETADFIYNLIQTVQGLGIMGAIGDAWNRVWGDMVEFASHFDSVLRNLLPALKNIGTAIGTGLAVSIGVLWKAGAALLSVFEKFLDVAGPIISFLGDHLQAVLTIGIGLWLTFGRNAAAATLGVTGFATKVASSFTGISDKFLNAGGAIQNFGSKVKAETASINTQLTGLTGSTTRIGTAIQGVGAGIGAVASKVGNGLAVMATKFESFGKIAAGVMSNATLIMAGFFSGQMAAKAETLGGAITALIPTFVSLGIALIAIGGPIGIITALGTAIAVIVGMLTGKASSAANNAMDMATSISAIGESMTAMGDEFDGNDALLVFRKQLDELNPGNFTNVKTTLDATGHSVGELAGAFGEGGDAVKKFMDKVKTDFVDANFSGKLKDFEFFKIDPNNVLGPKLQITGDEFERLAERGAKGLDIIDQHTGTVSTNVDGLADATRIMGDSFDASLGGTAIQEFGNALTRARESSEAMGPIMELQKTNQEYINDKAKTWVDRIRDANTALDDTKQRMRDLLNPADDVTQNIVDLYSKIRESKDAFINPQTGQPWTTMPSPDTEAGAKYFEAVKGISGLWTDTQTIIANGINPALDDAVKIDVFKSDLTAKRDTFISNLVNFYKITPDQAAALADQIGATLPDEAKMSILLNLDGDPTVLANQYTAMIERFKTEHLDSETVKIFAQFELDETSPEAHEFAKILGGLKNVDPIQVQAVVGTLDKMDPGLRDFVRSAITSGSVAPENILSYIDLIPQLTTQGVGGVAAAYLAASLQGQPPETIQQLVALIPTISDVSGLGPDGAATIARMLVGSTPEARRVTLDIISNINNDKIPGLTPEQDLALSSIIAGANPVTGQKILDIFPSVALIDGLDATQQAEISRILAGKTPEDAQAMIDILTTLPPEWGSVASLIAQTTPAQAKLNIEVSVSAVDAALRALAALGSSQNIQFNPMGFGADGGIFTQATNMVIGEDGPEVLIPLSKPAQARQLIEQSGLYNRFPQITSTSTLGGGIPAVLPAGTFQAVTPATTAYANAIASVGFASNFSADAQGVLAQQLNSTIDTSPVDGVTAAVDELTAAALRANDALIQAWATAKAAELFQAQSHERDSSGESRYVNYEDGSSGWQQLMADGTWQNPDGMGPEELAKVLADTRARKEARDAAAASSMSLLSNMPTTSLSTPSRSDSGHQFDITVNVEAGPDTTPEHAAMVGKKVGDEITRKLAIKSAVFSS